MAGSSLETMSRTLSLSPLPFRTSPTPTKRGTHHNENWSDLSESDENQNLMEKRKRVVSIFQRRLEDMPWYHGKLRRKDAEALVEKDGQFLVRDCISDPGNYVLTCRDTEKALHFMINRINLPASNPDTPFYQFEEEQFTSVVDLVEFYITHSKPITELSKCVISKPVQKKTVTEMNGNILSPPLSPADLLCDENKPGDYAEIRTKSPLIPPPTLPKRVGLIPKLAVPNPNLTKRPLPKPPVDILQDKPLSQRVMLLQASKRLGKSSSEKNLLQPKNGLSHINSTSATELRKIEEKKSLKAPSKPTRAPSLRSKDKPTVIVRGPLGGFVEESIENIRANDDDDDFHEYCDIDYEDIDYAEPESPLERLSQPVQKETIKPLQPPPLPLRKPKLSPHGMDRDSACVPDFSIYDFPVPSTSKQTSDIYDVVKLEPVSVVIPARIKLERVDGGEFFQDSEIPPLSISVWDKLCKTLLEVDPLSLAKSLTKSDCDFLEYFSCDQKEFSLSERIESGLTLMLLPQGNLFRKEILTRADTLKTFVLGSLIRISDKTERVLMLKQWIETARHLRYQIKNFYSFHSLMKAFSSPQVKSLASIWSLLRENHTSTAVAYETVLKPFFLEMDKKWTYVESPLIPHLLPLIRVMEPTKCGKIFENDDFDDFYGLDSLLKLLEGSRKWFYGEFERLKKQADETLELTSAITSPSFYEKLNKIAKTGDASNTKK